MATLCTSCKSKNNWLRQPDVAGSKANQRFALRVRSGPLFYTMKKIRIVYCKPCGYLPRAEEMKKELEKRLKGKVTVKLEPGDSGIYDVYSDGKLVFSKHREMRFPDNEEIVRGVA